MAEQLRHPGLRAPSSSSPRFHPFPKLATELRLQIWNLAVANIPPQTVTNRPKIKGNSIPSLLHVNREARGVALKRYRRHDKLYTWNGTGRLFEDTPYAWFIDYNSDSLLLNCRQPLGLRPGLGLGPNLFIAPRDFMGVMRCPDSAPLVQKLTVGIVAFGRGIDPPYGYYEGEWVDFWRKVFDSYPHLTELHLLVGAATHRTLAGIKKLELLHIWVLREQWRFVEKLEGRKIVVKLNGEEVSEEYSWLRLLLAEGI